MKMALIAFAGGEVMSGQLLKNGVGFEGLLGQSIEMGRVCGVAAKVASRRHPVLLLGESGTGKQAMARIIHRLGLHPDRAFEVVECESMPAAIEADLFGRILRGLSPRSGQPGPSPAPAGTVFLAEVGAMPLELQEKLLRALNDCRAGGAAKGDSPRIIAASSRELEVAVEQGAFRKSLYVRLNVTTLRLPPLRDRKEDIGLLAECFLKDINASQDTTYSLSPAAMRLLVQYAWPGNVRELKECLQQAAQAGSGPLLDVADLPPYVRSSRQEPPAKHSLAKTARILSLAEVERQAILSALERLNGDKLMAARALGIGKTTLYRKLKEYGTSLPKAAGR
jgi:two-component system response regulator HydG